MIDETLELYRWAVQDPQTHAAVLAHMYERLRGRRPRTLREDFAGTSAESVAWIAADQQRRAVAVDRDADALDWAARRARRLLGDRAGQLQFATADVFDVMPPQAPPADVIAALNFSLLYFHDRDELRDYFCHARQSLALQGILVGSLFGGPGAMRVSTDVRRIEPSPAAALPGERLPPAFDYRWEQRRYNAVTARLDCRIHFALDAVADAPPRLIEDAFVYDWRLWTLPEVLLREAGFADAQVWRHTCDAALGPQAVFLGPVDAIENADTWTAYVIGTR